ncbi:hypothetical protein [Rhizobium sp.]|uniref:hypothetical protein n=1 Tax=Rhizobium sp. TaxID=391 RepID=UPI000E88C52A|nr:hypothetical protein [Rhizobium sp.]
MALQSDYSAGTVNIAANGTAVTGAGTAWLKAGFTAGDLLFANGYIGLVASVESDTALTLDQPWRGGALSAGAYRLRYQGDGSRISAQARQLIELLGGSGNLEALGKIAAIADRLAYFTGAGQMAATGLTAFARSLLDDADDATARKTLGAQAALGFTPVQAGGPKDSRDDNKIAIGWSDDYSLRLKIDATEFGSHWPIKARDNVAKVGDTMTGPLTVQNTDVKGDARFVAAAANGTKSRAEFGQRSNGDGYVWAWGYQWTFATDGSFYSPNLISSGLDIRAHRHLFAGGDIVVGEGQAQSSVQMRAGDKNGRFIFNDASGIGFLNLSNAWVFTAFDDGRTWSKGNVSAGAATLQTDGNVIGSIWSNWGYPDIYNAVGARIEARGAAFADNRVSRLSYRLVSLGYFDPGEGQAPSGAVLTGLNSDPSSGRVNRTLYRYVQVYDPVRGWVSFVNA